MVATSVSPQHVIVVVGHRRRKYARSRVLWRHLVVARASARHRACRERRQSQPRRFQGGRPGALWRCALLQSATLRTCWTASAQQATVTVVTAGLTILQGYAYTADTTGRITGMWKSVMLRSRQGVREINSCGSVLSAGSFLFLPCGGRRITPRGTVSHHSLPCSGWQDVWRIHCDRCPGGLGSTPTPNWRLETLLEDSKADAAHG